MGEDSDGCVSLASPAVTTGGFGGADWLADGGAACCDPLTSAASDRGKVTGVSGDRGANGAAPLDVVTAVVETGTGFSLAATAGGGWTAALVFAPSDRDKLTGVLDVRGVPIDVFTAGGAGSTTDFLSAAMGAGIAISFEADSVLACGWAGAPVCRSALRIRADSLVSLSDPTTLRRTVTSSDP